MMMKIGNVTLLGAGPGELDLLTIRAAKALAAADVLLLDDLVAPEIAALAPRARVIRVGKRGGCHSTPQAFIERLMCRHALRGERVVRVKGGDALLFGRAGEELAALRAAGVPVDIVNGISAGFAAAASLQVPLTHREHCQGVTFVTAHKQDHGEPDWRSLAAAGTTLVIYMGMSRLDTVAAGLLAALDASMPAAIVQWAGTPAERRWTGTLGRLAAAAAETGLGSPAVILVGRAIGDAVDEAIGGVLDEAAGKAIGRALDDAANKAVSEALDEAVSKTVGGALDEAAHKAFGKTRDEAFPAPARDAGPHGEAAGRASSGTAARLTVRDPASARAPVPATA
ncbi:Uroporphyrinogen-III methyltransferase [Burkholderia singularis]|uniref:uroporphyrinogen-III C-methyltransferase n=1 Tax=Burkholderia singularis TaxID=1503053 RepID=A0A238H6Y6_9BURK|nr:Uroporphyrinogen-III methyltransferase [Burkholderia singularis]